MTAGRHVALAAGTAPVYRPGDQVRLAADAGYDAAGLRLTGVSPADLAEVRRVLDDTGLYVLDVEVVRLGPDRGIDAGLVLLESAAAVGARHLLVVSEEHDRSRTVDLLGSLCEAAGALGVRPVLEFMAFTAVATLGDAASIVAAAGGGAGVLVDPLHLARTGSAPEEVAAFAPELFPYAQICDAPARPPAGLSLADEARHHRLLPGDGALPLARFVAALPAAAPLSVEVMSDAELAARGPAGMASAGLAATRSLWPRPGPETIDGSSA